jgi:histidine triad (HIT) family protein
MEDPNCIFCKIVKGEIPCYKIYEDEDVLVFLDAFPFLKGQSLVIPKKHIAPWLFDTDDETYCKLMKTAKKVCQATQKGLGPFKTGLMVEGLEMDHVHIKIFPLTKDGYKDYPKILDPLPSKEEMTEIAEKVKEALE